MGQNRKPLTPEAATDEPASSSPPESGDGAAFEPVPLRYRTDGLTPARQRAYVEALADCGVAREAAARIGVSEQAINRVRRRADARSFDLACEATHRFGARRIRSVAFERAIEGTIKRHYYHGELKSEEVVYDNRLLVYLLGKTAHLAEPPAETEAVIENWEAYMEAVELGHPPPTPTTFDADPDDCEAEPLDEDAFLFEGDEVWQDEDGVWWTRFPPSADFCGEEQGTAGEDDYQRTLSAAELEVTEPGKEEKLAELCAQRDAWFGFRGARFPNEDEDSDEAVDAEGGEASAPGGRPDGADRGPLSPDDAAEDPFSSPREAETYETSDPPSPVGDADAGGGEGDPPPRRGPRITAL